MADGSQTLRAKVVAYTRARLSQKVGDGECYALADKALNYAKAKSAPAYGVVTEDADYIWGVPVELKDVMPGDILQFRDFAGSIRVTKTSEGGTASWTTQDYKAEHHSAIVEHNSSNGEVTILEQGKGSGYRVRRVIVPIFSNSFDQKRDGVTTETSTSISGGTIKAYRPAAKSH